METYVKPEDTKFKSKKMEKRKLLKLYSYEVKYKL